MTQEEQGKRLVESLEQLSQAWRSMGQTADALCKSMEKTAEVQRCVITGDSDE